MKYSPALLLAPALASAAVLPRDEWTDKVDEWARETNPPAEILESFKNKPEGELTLEPYKQPNEYVTSILSVGDSYTAGVGANNIGEDWYPDSGRFADGGCARYKLAWPERLRDHSGWVELQGEGYRRNNFGACSGATISEIREKQLEQGENKDEDQYKKIGKPQLAVMTAGGNDMRFSEIIKTCIYEIQWDPSCDQVLSEVQDKLTNKKDEVKKDYQGLWADVIRAGRMAKGANPPESFQIYAGTYIPFFNEEDDVCDEVVWGLVSHQRGFMTKDIRKKLNDLVRTLNEVIKEAADEYKAWGVFWVDSYQKSFDGHRFCDPTGRCKEYDLIYHGASRQDYGDQSWFWSIHSPGFAGEGYNHPVPGAPKCPNMEGGDESRDAPFNVSQAILDNLIPDKSQQAQISEENPPSKFNPVFNDPAELDKAIAKTKIKDGDGDVEIELDDSWFRIFHPKGSAHDAIRDGFFDTIKVQRKWDFKDQDNPS